MIGASTYPLVSCWASVSVFHFVSSMFVASKPWQPRKISSTDSKRPRCAAQEWESGVISLINGHHYPRSEILGFLIVDH